MLSHPPVSRVARRALLGSALFVLALLSACGGGGGSNSSTASSSSATAAASNVYPSLSKITPTTVARGGSAFTLTATGSGFTKASLVVWNGEALQTTYVSSTELLADVPAQNIANFGAASIAVENDLNYSSKLTVTIGFTVKVYDQAARKLAWDNKDKLMLISVPATAATHANSVAAFDPATGTVGSPAVALAGADNLALSDDDQYLYASADTSGSLVRYTLPALTQDEQIDLGSNSKGPNEALDIEAAPGAPDTVAVSMGHWEDEVTPNFSQLTIYDGTVARSNSIARTNAYYVELDSIAWGADPSVIYGSVVAGTAGSLYVVKVDASGASVRHEYMSTFSWYRTFLHYDATTNLIYAEDGEVVNSSANHKGVLADYVVPGKLVIDTAKSRIYAVLARNYLGPLGMEVTLEVAVYDLYTRKLLRSVLIPTSDRSERPWSLVRWGDDGLAFIGLTALKGGGWQQKIWVIQGDFIK